MSARLKSHLRKVDHFRELEKIRNYTNRIYKNSRQI